MVYRSIFQRIARKDPSFSKGLEHQEYNGSFDDMLNELQSSYASLRNNNELSDMFVVSLHPLRLLKSALRHKIDSPTGTEVDLITSIVDFGLRTYKGKLKKEDFEKLRENILRSGNFELLDYQFSQQEKPISWYANRPKITKAMVEAIEEECRGRPILALPIADGGIPPSIDPFLIYCDRHPKISSIFYPIKFSLGEDDYPRITTNEARYLVDASQGRRIILLDEDTSSGETLDTLMPHLMEIFEGRKIVPIVSFDAKWAQIDEEKERILGGQEDRDDSIEELVPESVEDVDDSIEELVPESVEDVDDSIDRLVARLPNNPNKIDWSSFEAEYKKLNRL